MRRRVKISSAATGTKTRSALGTPPVRPVPSQARVVGDLGAGGDDGALVDLEAAGADQAGAEGHDQRMDAEDADADAVGQADEQRRAGRRGRARRPGRAPWVATMKAAMVATVATERSMPPVSMARVWQPASMASGMANFTVLAIQRSLTMPGRRICSTTTRSDEQEDERHERIVAEEALDAAAGRAAGSGAASGHGVRPRMAMKAPNMTTTTMIVPSMIEVTFGSTARSVRSVRTRRRMKTATIGPSEAAAAAAEDDAAEDDGGDAGEEVGAGDRRADAGGGGERRGRPSPRRGRRWRRRRCGCGRPARRCGRRRARSSRWRRSRGRAASGGAGSRRRRGRRRGRRAPSAATGWPAVPVMSAFSQSAAAPPGEGRTRSAAPCRTKSIGERHHDVGHAGDDDEQAVERAEGEAHERGRGRRRGRRPPRWRRSSRGRR